MKPPTTTTPAISISAATTTRRRVADRPRPSPSPLGPHHRQPTRIRISRIALDLRRPDMGIRTGYVSATRATARRIRTSTSGSLSTTVAWPSLRPGRAFAVGMHVQTGMVWKRRQVRHRTDEVDHRAGGRRDGVPERQTADRAQVVLELRRRRPFDRPVAGVVDPRRELVAQQSLPHLEQLDREDAHVTEPFHHGERVPFGHLPELVGDGRGGRRRDAEDPVAMDVLDERVEARLAVAAADAEDRELPIERHERLQDRRHLPERAPRVRCVVHPRELDLARRRTRAVSSSGPPGRRRPRAPRRSSWTRRARTARRDARPRTGSSRSRSCATSSDDGGGKTGTSSSRNRVDATGRSRTRT